MCIYMFVCVVYVRVCAHVHLYVCGYVLQGIEGFFLSITLFLPTLFLQTGSLTNLELNILARLAEQQVSGLSCFATQL